MSADPEGETYFLGESMLFEESYIVGGTVMVNPLFSNYRIDLLSATVIGALISIHGLHARRRRLSKPR